MMKSVLSLTIAAALLLLVPPGVVLAASTGNTGQPSQSCQAQPASPGNASLSPGAPFNEPTATSAGGQAGIVYAGNRLGAPSTQSPKAVSQYDVACFQVSTQVP
jgi:hypothetical protein